MSYRTEISEILDKKWYGGLYHLYNTDDTWEQWISEFEVDFNYQPHDIEKFLKIFNSNRQYIEGKVVVDMACNLGYFSLAASNLRAKKVIGLEIRLPYIKTFNRVLNYWPNKNVELRHSNLENLFDLKKNLTEVDTVLYTGHLYHTNQNEEILKTLSDSSASCIILESVIPDNGTDINGFQHNIEPTDDPLNGYIDENTLSIKIKKPTLEKASELLQQLGWAIVSCEIIELFQPNRFVITATRNDQK